MSLRYLAAVLWLWLAPALAVAAPFSALYVFGDSLSDTGNLAAIRGEFPEPFYRNRVSNGPVAVDVLAARLGLSAEASLYLIGRSAGGNYAVAGARADGNDLIDLTSQVVVFLAHQGNDAPADALYVVFIGGNDVRNARSERGAAAANAIIDAAAAAVADNVERLIRAGARSLLVMNSPDVGLLPETRALAQERSDPFLPRRATRLSQRYGAKLHRVLQRLQRKHPDVWLQEVDVYTASRLIAQQPARFGIDNIVDACFSTETLMFHPGCAAGANFERFYFFDELHPTAKVHRLIGEGIYQGGFATGCARAAGAARE